MQNRLHNLSALSNHLLLPHIPEKWKIYHLILTVMVFPEFPLRVQRIEPLSAFHIGNLNFMVGVSIGKSF